MSVLKSLRAPFIAVALTVAGLTAATLTAAAVAHAQTPGSDNMHAFADLVRAQGEYQKNVAEAQLLYAQAQLVQAQALGELQRARELQLLVNRARRELTLLTRDENTLRRRVKAIEDRAELAETILAGRVTPVSMQAFVWLQTHAVGPQDSLKAMTQSLPAIPASEFSVSPGRVLPPFAGENVGQLVDHLRRHNVSVVPWGIAHQAIAQALVAMSTSVNEKVAGIRQDLVTLRDSVDPFNLPERGPSQPGLGAAGPV
jgi:hypothetical protein